MGVIKKLRNVVPFRIASVVFRKQKYQQVVIHKSAFTRTLSIKVLLRLFCRGKKGKFSCPQNLTILLVHNREQKTLLEYSLDYLGIKNYTVIRPELKRDWFQTIKLRAIYDYLSQGKCKTEFILYCDSDDAILRDNPSRAIDLLKEYDCEALFSNTSSTHYECMPEVQKWIESIARSNGVMHKYIHLNSGVYVARQDFLKDILQEAVGYVTDHDFQIDKVRKLRKENPDLFCVDFPRGLGCDQSIFRFLHPRFYPRMKIDFASKLAIR